ncbi:hypothetical protein TSUD_226020 [Trifolium subterraneum]|uniref:Uncharacterized protein n=1 Tax=Trifolium subterraneum TaxID=3900 RepID=A0A2Z6N3Z3_TRISU|nr:hypothetical protein TSUD_226020 [Trifolium subterraneum]
MACTTWKPPMNLPNKRETTQTLFSQHLINFGSTLRIQKLNSCCRFAASAVVKKSKFIVRGCGCEESSSEEEYEYYGVTEEDKDFVKVLRESNPYFLVHRDRVFVVLISAEIIATPNYFHAILKEQEQPS